MKGEALGLLALGHETELRYTGSPTSVLDPLHCP